MNENEQNGQAEQTAEQTGQAAQAVTEETAETAAQAETERTAQTEHDLLQSLTRAYERLKAEFDRRNERLKELEQAAAKVPLMTAGTGVVAPAEKPKTIAEAGELALKYFRK